ncbi:MAG: host attachment protein [Alphaproteobacteria bacterium]|nr:host attachment protein [Alphaproteobacteria bacterium]
MKNVNTWILIADGGKARVLVSEGRGSKLNEYEKMRMRAEELPHAQPGTERPARVHESANPARHAIEPRMTPKRHIESDFAREIADRLDGELSNYERLVIVAAPKMLGDLRDFMSSAVAKKIEATVSKDLTNTPDNEILDHLNDEVKL